MRWPAVSGNWRSIFAPRAAAGRRLGGVQGACCRGQAKAYEQTGDAERAAADIAEATQIESAGLDPTGAEACR